MKKNVNDIFIPRLIVLFKASGKKATIQVNILDSILKITLFIVKIIIH